MKNNTQDELKEVLIYWVSTFLITCFAIIGIGAVIAWIIPDRDKYEPNYVEHYELTNQTDEVENFVNDRLEVLENHLNIERTFDCVNGWAYKTI